MKSHVYSFTDISDLALVKASRILGWRLGIPEEQRADAVRDELRRIFAALEAAGAYCEHGKTKAHIATIQVMGGRVQTRCYGPVENKS